MKTRQSLVSNSSSASFICHRPIVEVAHDIWKRVMDDWIDWYPKNNAKSIFKKIKKICEQDDVQLGRNGICFPSTGENTYIIIMKNGKCAIDTASNHKFHELDEFMSVNEDNKNEVYDSVKDQYFYALHTDDLILLKYGEIHILENSDIDLVCPECEKRWKKQDRTMIVKDCYYIDNKDNKYCTEHYIKLREEKKIPKNNKS